MLLSPFWPLFFCRNHGIFYSDRYFLMSSNKKNLRNVYIEIASHFHTLVSINPQCIWIIDKKHQFTNINFIIHIQSRWFHIEICSFEAIIRITRKNLFFRIGIRNNVLHVISISVSNVFDAMYLQTDVIELMVNFISIKKYRHNSIGLFYGLRQFKRHFQCPTFNEFVDIALIVQWGFFLFSDFLFTQIDNLSYLYNFYKCNRNQSPIREKWQRKKKNSVGANWILIKIENHKHFYFFTRPTAYAQPGTEQKNQW